MKKIIALCSMIVALGFVATGCGGGAPAPASAPAATNPVNGDATDENWETPEAGGEEAPAAE